MSFAVVERVQNVFRIRRPAATRILLMSAKVIASRQELLQVFDGFRSELDEHNDRREKLIKVLAYSPSIHLNLMDLQTSRDITNLSKKLIFLLHRLSTDEADKAKLASEATKKLSEIATLFAAQREDLADDRFWRYQRCVSPGLQEYIEAQSFAHYLLHDSLITWQEVQDSLSDESGLVSFYPLNEMCI
jgi:hypothetical protein